MPRSLIVTLLLSAAAIAAEDGKQAITNPKEAGPEFAVQGEYAGEATIGDQKEKWGVQVIALGEGKLHAVGYEGGLPGDGWKRGEDRESADGEMQDDGSAILTDGGVTLTIKEGVMTINEGGRDIITLKKVERKSPTLGMGPPEKGSGVLFDGTSADAWENGTIIEENLLGATNCSTKQKFGDHRLHIEFRTPYMPASRGQARGNSGVYIQGRYECQVLDSFGLEGKDNECGGIYKIAQPAVNMCLPPLAWQTYDIDFTAAKYGDDGKKTANARVTIKHNGLVIHDDLELPNHTPGRNSEGPGQGAIFLQNHGNPVAFRNIWVVRK